MRKWGTALWIEAIEVSLRDGTHERIRSLSFSRRFRDCFSCSLSHTTLTFSISQPFVPWVRQTRHDSRTTTHEGSRMQTGSLLLCLLFAFGFAVAATTDKSSEHAKAKEWQLEDIAAFRERFLAVDRAFTPETRAMAEERLSRLERTSEPLSPIAFSVELCRIAALADNGHTGCVPTPVGREICRQWSVIEGTDPQRCVLQPTPFEIPDFKYVPIAFHPFGEEFNVVRVVAERADLLGARLVMVENKPIESIRETLRSFAGGPVARRDSAAARVLASPEQLQAVGLIPNSDAVVYELITQKGERIKRRFALAQPSEKAATLLSLPDESRASWAFQQPMERFRFRDAPEINAVIIQLRQHVDAGKMKLATFLETSEKQRVQLGRKNVVLDMRFNGGGNLMLTRDFIRQWPEHVPGQFFVLTSRQTGSAAIASIAYLKQAGADRVVIVGEPVGDRLMFFSDGRAIRLPNSGRYFMTAIARMDFRDGCRQYDDCFAGIAQPGRPASPLPAGLESIDRLPIAIASLEPDVAAPWTIESWLMGTDPMMDAVTELVRQ
jgi:hypothetical protein